MSPKDLKWFIPPKIFKKAEFLVENVQNWTQQASQSVEQFTKEAVQNMENLSKQVAHDVEEFTKKAAHSVQVLSKQSGQIIMTYWHTQYAGEENLKREQRIKQLQAAVKNVKADLRVFLQQVNAEASHCLENLNTLTDEQEEASASHRKSIDILSKPLIGCLDSYQDILDRIVDCQKTIAKEESTMFRKGQYRVDVGAIKTPLIILLLRKVGRNIMLRFRKIPSVFDRMASFISILSAIAQIVYSIFLRRKNVNDVKELDQDLKKHEEESISILQLMDKVFKLMTHYAQELQHNMSNETKSSVKRNIKCLLKELSFVSATFANQYQ